MAERARDVSDYPKRVTVGDVLIEAHAPWCVVEHLRALLAGSSGDRMALITQGLKLECMCESKSEQAKYTSLRELIAGR